MGLRLLGRPEKKEKKESTVKGDWRDPAKHLPCVNGIFSFYRDLDRKSTRLNSSHRP